MTQTLTLDQRKSLMKANGVRDAAIAKWEGAPLRSTMSIGGGKPVFRIADMIGWTDSDDYWGDMVTPKMVQDFLSENKGKDVVLDINSPGGYVYGGMGIANLVMAHEGKTTAIVTGIAASAASVIAAACDEVLMAEASVAMLHAPHTIVIGNAQDLMDAAVSLEKEGEASFSVYKKRMSAELVDEIMKGDKDWTFTPEECVENGFADGLYVPKAEKDEDKEKGSKAEINRDEESKGGAVSPEDAKRREEDSRAQAERRSSRMEFLISALPD